MARGHRTPTPERRAEELRRRRALGAAIAARREELGLKQRECGEVLGMTQEAWSKVEYGRVAVRLVDVVELSNVLRVEPTFFVEKQFQETRG